MNAQYLPVSGDQIKATMIDQNIRYVQHHACSICDEFVYFVREGDHLFFDSSCGCAQSNPTPRDWNDAAEWINEQTNPDYQVELLKRFGFSPD